MRIGLGRFGFVGSSLLCGGYGFGQGLVFAFQYGIGDTATVQADGFGRVVVTRDNVFHAFRIVIGIHHADYRNTQFAGFGQRTFLVTGINHENGVGQAFHVFNAAE